MNPEAGASLPIGTTTDENGVFIIPNVASGKYIVRVSMIGNVTQEREITIGDSEINLGKIELAEDTKLLQEVVVTGQKSQLSVNAERRFFLTSSLRTPKIFVKEFSYFLMPCHQHGLGVNLLVQR